MTQKLLTLPLRVGFKATRTAVGLSIRIAETAIEILRPSGHSGPHAAPMQTPTRPAGPPPATSSSTSQRQRPETRTNGQPGAAPREESDQRPEPRDEAPPAPTIAPVTPPEDQPDTPLSPTEDAVKTIEDEEEVVAEFAEPGAEDGAGAQLDVEEPWEGYADMNAETVIGRIGEADPATLAIVELYEQTHKKRQTVLAAAEKRLRTLSPPDAG